MSIVRPNGHADQQPPPDKGPKTRGQLLIIDDEEEILKALRRQFRREYDVYIAVNAEEGLRIIKEVPIQVIITDQRMPGVTGVQFLAQAKKELPDATRLLLTGYADIQAVIDAINEGNVFRYITKPWNTQELATIVREAFERHALLVQNRRLVEELKAANAQLEQRVRERTAELAEANARLRAANAQLEQRVRERTAELAEANARLRAANAQKDYFISMAAHDLRNPLTLILGFVESVLDYPDCTEEERRRYLTLVRRSAEGMVRLLDDLLDLAQIERGQIELRPAAVDLGTFLGEVVEANRLIADRKGITLASELPSEPITAWFDRDRIEQVLNNLISNAVKFSRSGTTVTVGATATADEVRIAVVDQGPGIPAEETARIFGEFTRGSARPTAGERSTGLGLAICQRIVALHSGRIEVDSEVGRGSRFVVVLPRSSFF